MMTNCNTSSLSVYVPSVSNPWNEEKIRHLYRRIGFGATDDMIRDALTTSPSQLVDNLIQEAINTPDIVDPGWGYWNKETTEASYESQFGIDVGIISDTRRYLERLTFDLMRNNNLSARLITFWTNHFVTESLNEPSYMFQQLFMRQKYCIGNFKEFVYEVGLDNAMLDYLGGRENKAGNPNENYARELYELFTLGVDNGYTETDIAETARALTGYTYRSDGWADIEFQEKNYDSGSKTIFGQTGNWGYDDVIRILFEEKSENIANYMCSKFYKYFISPNVNEAIVEELAQVFLDNDFEIAPVIERIFKSEHFYDNESVGTIIKSPFDLIISLQKELEMDFNSPLELNEQTWLFFFYVEARVFDPPNVAGWPGDENWINSITLPERWSRTETILKKQRTIDSDIFADFARKRFETNEYYENVVRGIVDFFIPSKLVHDDEYQAAIDEFSGNVPSNYYEDGTWSLNFSTLGEQVYDLMVHISKMPEFQIK